MRRLLAFLTLSSLVGCRQVLGIDDRQVAEGSGGAGGAAEGACNTRVFATLPVPACDDCLERSCCAELDACAADPSCAGCLAPDGYCKPPPKTFDDLVACVHGSCQGECYPAPPVTVDILQAAGDLGAASGDCIEPGPNVTCNPMRQSSTCNWEAGGACDVVPRNPFGNNSTGFACYLSHRRHINETCGLVEGMCHFGLTCVRNDAGEDRCARICCHDQDCQAGVCNTEWFDWKFGQTPNAVGVCVNP
jgi:hypothetical protein